MKTAIRFHVYTILLLLLTSSLVAGYALPSSVIGTNVNLLKEKPESLSVDQDQTLISSQQIINDIIPYLIRLKNSTGSWLLPAFSTSEAVYTGLAGGIAGIGMELLNLYSDQSNSLNVTNRALALQLSKEVANNLRDLSTSNTTGYYWNVTMQDTTVDLGYDFGLAGIGLFYAKLYNSTGISEYADISEGTFKAIKTLANTTGGLHWNSEIYESLSHLAWYPTTHLKYYTKELYTSNVTYFNGKGLGTLGVGDAALQSINLLSIGNKTSVEHQLVNSSVYWLSHQFSSIGPELSFNLTSPSIGIVSPSMDGLGGAIGFFGRLSQYTGNSTYMDWANGMIHWINGTTSGISRLTSSLVINGTKQTALTLGLSHGLAGTIESIYHYAVSQSTKLFDKMLATAVAYLHNTGKDTGEFYEYGEFTSNGILVNQGSLTYQTGGGGILSVIDKVSNYLGLKIFSEDIAKAKSYVYSRVGTFLGSSVIPNIQTSQPEVSVYIGFLSSYHVLLIPIAGQLQVDTTTIDYGTIQIGRSVSKLIELRNTGDKVITASWNDLATQSNFVSNNASAIIEGRSVYRLFVSFIPLQERDYSLDLVIKSGIQEFTVHFIGQGFDFPVLKAEQVLENGSVIKKRQNIEFVVNASDSSDIAKVDISINGNIRTMTTVVGSNLHQYVWSLRTISNGTYVITFTAYDNAGYTTSLKYTYSVSIYDPPLDERIFSRTVLYGLIGLGVVLVVAAIMVTRKYMQ